MKTRGLGRVYQPTYRDRKTDELRKSPTWWIQYYVRGKKYRESSNSTNRSDAVKLLRRRMGEMGRGPFVGPDAERVTFENLTELLVNDYEVNSRKSLDRAQDAIDHLRESFGSARALDVTPDRVDTYILNRRDQENAKPATIHYELAMLKRMFSLAVEKGKLDRKPYIPSLRVRNTRTGFFEESEFRAVLSHLPVEIQAVAEFAYMTGWRKQEILKLQWRQVDFEAGTMRLEPGTTKNEEGREFPFSVLPALHALLERQKERTEAVQVTTEKIVPWVFHRNGRPIKDYRKTWRKACDAAGIPGRIPHDFRRTAVRNLERAGVPRSVAMKLTGHLTESVYRRYAIASNGDLAEGVAKLAALQEAQAKAQADRTLVPFPSDKARTKQSQS